MEALLPGMGRALNDARGALEQLRKGGVKRSRCDPCDRVHSNDKETDHVAQPSTADEQLQAFDIALPFVNVRKVRNDGLVEFDFAIGDPELAVELILPNEAFREFCRDQGVHPGPLASIAATTSATPCRFGPDEASQPTTTQGDSRNVR